MAGKDRMNVGAPAVKLTYDDFLLFPEDGKRHELIDGEHYVTASPNLKHQVILGNLHLVMGTWLEAHPGGRVFLNVRGAPDLVVEISAKSTRKRDETIKRRLYERSGVVE